MEETQQPTSLDMLHDKESYIITIKRKGQESPSVRTFTGRYAPALQDQDSSSLHDPQASYNADGTAEPTTVTAPIPGTIIALKVKAGETIREGQELAVLEAMKMENSIEAQCSGTVCSVSVSVGDTVSEGTVILTVK